MTTSADPLPAPGERAIAPGGRVDRPSGPGGAANRPSGSADRPSVTRTASKVFGWVASAAGLNLAVAVLTARMLSVGGRGEVVLILTITGLTGMLAGIGTNTAVRYYLGRGDPRVTLGHYLGLSLILIGPQCGLTVAVVGPTLALVGAPERGPAVLAVTLALAAVTLAAIQLTDALNALGLIVSSARVSAAGSAATLALMAALAAGSRRPVPIAAVLGVFAVTGAAQAGAAVVLLTRAGNSPRPRLNRRASRLLLRTGAPALGLNVGTSLTFRLDRYLVGLFAGVSAVGVYSVAATASESLRLVPAAWGQVIFHRIASGQRTPRQVRADTYRVLAAMAVLAGLIGLGAHQLVEVFFGPAYLGAVTPLRILLAAELMLVTFQIDARVLAGLGRTGASGAAGVTGLAVVVVLDLLLIPIAGLRGAAWASVAAYAVMSAQARAAVSRGPLDRTGLDPGPGPPRRRRRRKRSRASDWPVAQPHRVVLRPNQYGGRLVFYSASADSAHWDAVWRDHQPSYRRSRAGHLPYQLRETFGRWAPAGGRVLEAGSGPALFTVAARARGFDAEAVDWAPATVARTRARLPDLPIRLGDVRDLDCPDQTYDAVYSPGVCEHFEEGPRDVLAETYRVLRPGGIAVVSTPCFNRYLRRRPRLLRPAGERPDGPFYQYAFTPGEMSDLLRDLGFDVLAVRPYAALRTLTRWSSPIFRRVPGRLGAVLTYAMDHLPVLRDYGSSCIWVARRPVERGPA